MVEITGAGKSLGDDDPMPDGPHAGKRMRDVPARYLLWCADQRGCHELVRAYVDENREALEQEAAER